VVAGAGGAAGAGGIDKIGAGAGGIDEIGAGVGGLDGDPAASDLDTAGGGDLAAHRAAEARDLAAHRVADAQGAAIFTAYRAATAPGAAIFTTQGDTDALAATYRISPATAVAIAAAGPDAIAAALRIFGGLGRSEVAAILAAALPDPSTAVTMSSPTPLSSPPPPLPLLGLLQVVVLLRAEVLGSWAQARVAPCCLAAPVPSLATGPFSATAFLRGLSPRPSTVAAADSALAAALEHAKTAAAAAEERVHVASLTWEHERTTADALARQVAEAERFLHTSTGERVASSPPTAPLQPGAGPLGGMDDPMVAYLHLQAVGIPHIKNLVTVVLDSNSTSYARWRDQLLLILRHYALDGHVLSDTPARARDPTWGRHDSIVMS
jgi:hypothetical protein